MPYLQILTLLLLWCVVGWHWAHGRCSTRSVMSNIRNRWLVCLQIFISVRDFFTNVLCMVRLEGKILVFLVTLPLHLLALLQLFFAPISSSGNGFSYAELCLTFLWVGLVPLQKPMLGVSYLPEVCLHLNDSHQGESLLELCFMKKLMHIKTTNNVLSSGWSREVISVFPFLLDCFRLYIYIWTETNVVLTWTYGWQQLQQ